MTNGSRLLVTALLALAATCGFASSAEAASGLAVMALAVIPALFAIPPAGRAVLGLLVLAATTLVAIATMAVADLAMWLMVICLAAAGSLIIWRGRSWAPLGSRFQGADPQPPGELSDPTALWKAQDRGDDPTQ